MSVPALLTSARQLHERYRRLHANTHNRNLLEEGAAVQAALLARLEADQLDPDHADVAWIADQQAMKGQSNDTLMAFYGRYLAPKEAGMALAMPAITSG